MQKKRFITESHCMGNLEEQQPSSSFDKEEFDPYLFIKSLPHYDMVSDFVGSVIGVDVGAAVGNFVGDLVGGGNAGARVGDFIGIAVGVDVGAGVGDFVGDMVGGVNAAGARVGNFIGITVGVDVGAGRELAILLVTWSEETLVRELAFCWHRGWG
jgi:hypothetical protein